MSLVVDLGARSYPIVIGELEGLGEQLAHTRVGRVVVVTNDVVGPLYGQAARGSLERAGFQVDVVVVPDGESHKHLGTWRTLVEALLGLGIDRQTAIVALGGGVTGDIAGFAAATTMQASPGLPTKYMLAKCSGSWNLVIRGAQVLFSRRRFCVRVKLTFHTAPSPGLESRSAKGTFISTVHASFSRAASASHRPFHWSTLCSPTLSPWVPRLFASR